MLKIGIDIGSTTAKIAVIDDSGELVFTDYRRHHAKAFETVLKQMEALRGQVGERKATLAITGSVGMGVAESCGIRFVQEVVAAARAIGARWPRAASMIDIGGEDAKVVFFHDGKTGDLRMNGNCAGGTGAFIDQMAVILNISTGELNDLALKADRVYPIASRCGVFCKTDIQNLIAKNVSREIIAASIFHAVAVQTVTTLAHGYDITPPLLLCGGPLTFIPALRKAFQRYLNFTDDDLIIPEHGNLLPAIGTAIYSEGDETDLSGWMDRLRHPNIIKKTFTDAKLLFTDEGDYNAWRRRLSGHDIEKGGVGSGARDVFIGIDSGSTTTKIAVIDDKKRLIWSYYAPNGGNPIGAVRDGLLKLRSETEAKGARLMVRSSCSTGYGEDLIRQAFQMRSGIIETIAHYLAARHFDPDVSFILDIGGQDMKAIFVNDGVIDRIEINEACSSGCGSFIETFAKTMGYSARQFAEKACQSRHPSDLGTRCTVFMNSKVKQVMREGATVEDIAAGLALSVVRNCLYKVLKLKDTRVLGKHIVVQGGTMRNDAVVRALEQLTGLEVTRSDIPELMGAYGCALYALEKARERERNGEREDPLSLTLEAMIASAEYSTAQSQCKGCENNCIVARYTFGSGKRYFSGNRCERVFTNGGKSRRFGRNAYKEKYELLFGSKTRSGEDISGGAAARSSWKTLVIGLPRVLNMYEEYPFWSTLLTECGFTVMLSSESRFSKYEACARMVMSDNICFPAKLVHSHIKNLIDRGADRILMPFVVHEKQRAEQNSYNCPIVTGYAEVVKSVQTAVDSPVISFKNRERLRAECEDYLLTLGVDKRAADRAFDKATAAYDDYERRVVKINEDILASLSRGDSHTCPSPIILLAGRPYHSDPLIQHKVAQMMSEMGIDVITDDIVRDKTVTVKDANFVAQWSYPNRILKAARWCAGQGRDIQFVELTSFGCGPDAFLTDIVRDVLSSKGKTLTLLKLDDINNVGSMKLRVRSLVESLKLQTGARRRPLSSCEGASFPPFDAARRHRKLLIPFFTPYISPLIPAAVRFAGYRAENMPLSDYTSASWGLKYANNEVCYPATLIVGDIIKAFKSGAQDPDDCAVVITQTGGQCRASNYISLIRKALIDAGYTNTPVISLSFSDSLTNDSQPAFRFNLYKMIPMAVRAILFSDAIGKLYQAAVVREKAAGLASRLKERWLNEGARMVERGKSSRLMDMLRQAVKDFRDITLDIERPRVGIVGEIFLKFNPFAQMGVMEWLQRRGIEAVSSPLSDFFMQSFVNRLVKDHSGVEKKSGKEWLIGGAYKLIRREIRKVNGICSEYKWFIPFSDIFEEAEEGRRFITLNAQFGEGWLLPAEIAGYHRHGIDNVVSLQPFGCIANHIVVKGIEKRIKKLMPGINLLSLDFDSGVSDVNITNRLLLFINDLESVTYCKPLD